MKDLYADCCRRAETISMDGWRLTLEDETSKHLGYVCIEVDPLQGWASNFDELQDASEQHLSPTTPESTT
jgi:hypothetical protein